MYGKIKTHPSLEKIYSKKLISENVVSQDEYEKIASDFAAHLSAEFDIAETYKPKEADWLKADWKKIKDGDQTAAKTAVSKKNLQCFSYT